MTAKFTVEATLGKLAKWLRSLGFDACSEPCGLIGSKAAAISGRLERLPGFYVRGPGEQIQMGKTKSVYVIADVKVTDESWIPDYAAMAHEVVHRHGGKYLARSANLTTL